MGNFKWGSRSLQHLKGIHPDLRKVADLALQLSPFDFIITDGRRTLKEQRDFVRKGVSKTMKSRHLYGFAIDYVAIVGNKVKYDLKAMKAISDAFKKAGNQLGIPVEWGGDWKRFKDTPHIQLSKSRYPNP